MKQGLEVALKSPSSRRAWIEIWDHLALLELCVSPSSRRAWIEICDVVDAGPQLEVALLAEGVDRNINIPPVACGGIASPSSRRAWIEILV